MSAIKDFLIRFPKIRTNCNIQVNKGHIDVQYFEDHFQIEPDDKTSMKSLIHFFELLSGENRYKDIIESPIQDYPGQYSSFLKVLDERRLIGEGPQNVLKGDGLLFLSKLEENYDKMQSNLGETKFSKLFADGGANKAMVIGWVFEYYQITKMAYDSIMPAISRTFSPFRDAMIDFVLDEYRHDLFMEKSLLSLDYSEYEVRNSLPLPSTNSLMSALSSFAHSDILSFMACLFIFEGNEFDGDDYLENLQNYGFNEGFISPQLKHHLINKNGDHFNASRFFFSKLESLSEHEMVRIEKNVEVIAGIFREMEREVFEYYRNVEVYTPRTLEALTSLHGGKDLLFTEDLLSPSKKIDEHRAEMLLANYIDHLSAAYGSGHDYSLKIGLGKVFSKIGKREFSFKQGEKVDLVRWHLFRLANTDFESYLVSVLFLQKNVITPFLEKEGKNPGLVNAINDLNGKIENSVLRRIEINHDRRAKVIGDLILTKESL